MKEKEKKRFLVVDDQPMVANSLKMALEFDGHHVEVASGGREALSHFEPGKFALVFTDFEMPEMNGHELASIIKARDPNQRIVMVTAYAYGIDKESLPQIDFLLGKPWSIESLRSAVCEVLGNGKA